MVIDKKYTLILLCITAAGIGGGFLLLELNSADATDYLFAEAEGLGSSTEPCNLSFQTDSAGKYWIYLTVSTYVTGWDSNVSAMTQIQVDGVMVVDQVFWNYERFGGTKTDQNKERKESASYLYKFNATGVHAVNVTIITGYSWEIKVYKDLPANIPYKSIIAAYFLVLALFTSIPAVVLVADHWKDRPAPRLFPEGTASFADFPKNPFRTLMAQLPTKLGYKSPPKLDPGSRKSCQWVRPRIHERLPKLHARLKKVGLDFTIQEGEGRLGRNGAGIQFASFEVFEKNREYVEFFAMAEVIHDRARVLKWIFTSISFLALFVPFIIAYLSVDFIGQIAATVILVAGFVITGFVITFTIRQSTRVSITRAVLSRDGK